MEKAGFKSKLQAIETAAYKLLNYILSAAAGFIISRAGVKNIFSPFSLSFLSVAPGSGMSESVFFQALSPVLQQRRFRFIILNTFALTLSCLL